MCGIAGIYGALSEVHLAAARRMSHAMEHRGPDGHGLWHSLPDDGGRGVILAHRRLAILDLSPHGAQPMVDDVSGDAVALNGEIYNYRELRSRLVAAGRTFRSTGDTEVLLGHVARGGIESTESLRGMFAFAFWSNAERSLTLARDGLGIKPLYLAVNPDPGGAWTVIFASEVRALLASGLLGTPRLDPAATASVVWNGFVVGPRTAVLGIESLPAGQLRVFGPSGREACRKVYWTIPSIPPAPAVGEDEVAEALRESVGLHLASDVPLAVFLSSGIDSSAVAHLAQQSAVSPVHTFTLAFEEPEFDESPMSRQIARALGTQHHEVTLTEQFFVEQLDVALDSLDQPTFDGLNSYYLSRAVREAGFTVALVGTGGDELFGGYTSFRDLPVIHRWSRRLSLVPRRLRVAAARGLATVLSGPTGSIPRQTRWAKLPEMARRGNDLLALYQLAYALFLPDFQESLLGGESPEILPDGLPDAMRERLNRETMGRNPLSALSVMEQRLFLGERLLRDNDAASMASSIEQRLPLVDRALFEVVDRLPDEVRYLPLRRKAILRRIGLQGLDPALFERPKRGFVLPFDRWTRTRLGGRMNDTMRDPEAAARAGLAPATVERLWHAFLEGAPGIYWSRIWALFVLIRWCHRHGVSR